jgi:hypothetical protein
MGQYTWFGYLSDQLQEFKSFYICYICILCNESLLFKFLISFCVTIFSLTCQFGYRYSVEKIPLYDSAEDEPSSKLLKSVNSSNAEYNVDGQIKYSMTMTVGVGSEHQFETNALVVQPSDPVPMEGVVVNEIKAEASVEMKLFSQDTQQAFSQNNPMISRIRSNSACRNYHIGPGSLTKKRSKHYSNGRLKQLAQKQVDAKFAALLLVTKEAQDEILRYEV